MFTGASSNDYQRDDSTIPLSTQHAVTTVASIISVPNQSSTASSGVSEAVEEACEASAGGAASIEDITFVKCVAGSTQAGTSPPSINPPASSAAGLSCVTDCFALLLLSSL